MYICVFMYLYLYIYTHFEFFVREYIVHSPKPGLAENLQAASSPADSSALPGFNIGFYGVCNRSLQQRGLWPHYKAFELFEIEALHAAILYGGIHPVRNDVAFSRIPGTFYPACYPLDRASALQEFALEFKYSKACCVLKEPWTEADRTGVMSPTKLHTLRQRRQVALEPGVCRKSECHRAPPNILPSSFNPKPGSKEQADGVVEHAGL